MFPFHDTPTVSPISAQKVPSAASCKAAWYPHTQFIPSCRTRRG